MLILGRPRHRAHPALNVAVFGIVALSTMTVVPLTAFAGPKGFSCTNAANYAVSSGDSWFAIADRVDVTPSQLLDANDADLTDTLLPGDTLCLPSGAAGATSCGGGTSYSVRAGDSWLGIARSAGVSGAAMFEVNGTSAATVIHPGDEVCLPAGAKVPTVASTALTSAPVRGACWFSDTWGSPRSGGRSHKGVDIIAASGSHVRAVVDGVLTKRAWDQPGKRAGNAWTLTAADGTYYFYGHLLDFAPGLQVGSRVSAGEIIGFVGETGNATTPHLHLEIHPRGGSAVNPYQAVLAMGECRRAIG